MNAKLYSIIIVGQENQETGFFQNFKVLSSNVEDAQNHVLMLKELEGKAAKVEEVQELDNEFSNGNFSGNNEILDKTGRSFFNFKE